MDQLEKVLANYIKWGFESRLKHVVVFYRPEENYIKWGFESRLKHSVFNFDN